MSIKLQHIFLSSRIHLLFIQRLTSRTQPCAHVLSHRLCNLMSGVVTLHLNIVRTRAELFGIVGYASKRIELVLLTAEMKHSPIRLLIKLARFPIARQPAADADDPA